MNQQLEQAYLELQQQFGQMIVYVDHDDWAEVMSDEDATGKTDEFVLVQDPQKFAAEYTDESRLKELWVERNRQHAVETARVICYENASDTWDELLAAVRRGEKYAIDQLVEFFFARMDNYFSPSSLLHHLSDYAAENPEYTAKGLRKPSQIRRKRWPGDTEGYLDGPSAAEWNQMSTSDKLGEARPTKAVLLWAEQEWRNVLYQRVKARDPELFPPAVGADYADWYCARYPEDEILEVYGGDDFDGVLDTYWKDDVAEYIAKMSDEEAFALTGGQGIQRLPSGVYWSERDY